MTAQPIPFEIEEEENDSQSDEGDENDDQGDDFFPENERHSLVLRRTFANIRHGGRSSCPKEECVFDKMKGKW